MYFSNKYEGHTSLQRTITREVNGTKIPAVLKKKSVPNENDPLGLDILSGGWGVLLMSVVWKLSTYMQGQMMFVYYVMKSFLYRIRKMWK